LAILLNIWNSEEIPELIAEKRIDHEICILNPEKFERMKNY